MRQLVSRGKLSQESHEFLPAKNPKMSHFVSQCEANGLNPQTLVNSNHLTTSSRPTQTSGTPGMGPLIASLAIFAHGLLMKKDEALCTTPGALASLQIFALLTVFRHCPSSVEAWCRLSSTSRSQVSGTTLNPQKQSQRVQMLFLCSCFLLCALRGYAVAGAEVGTSMLLETAYGWKRHSIGLLVSATFLASIPLRSIYARIRSSFSTLGWIRIFSGIAIGGTMLIFSKVTYLLPGGLLLVLADSVMFPALYLAEGLTRGLMMQFAKENYVFSVNLSSFLAIVLNNAARSIAPWLSRLNISASDDPSEGQDLFAACQLTCCILFLIAFEAGVRYLSPQAVRPVIVIGMPSLNEAENIESLTRVVDEGCQRYFPKHRCLLVNADCQSTDNTSAIFMNTATRCQKLALKTALPAQGKGAALKLVFSCMLEVNAEHGFCIDTDLKTVTPEWIRAFSRSMDFDFAAPRYLRHRLDGNITNMVIYPSMCAAFGYDLRQAIGGDFGFSRRAAEAFLAHAWPPKVEKYGIDIFMTTTVLKRGYSVCEVELPPKIHSPNLPKVKNMAPEVVTVLLGQLDTETLKGLELKSLPRIAWQSDGPMSIPEVKVDPAVFVGIAESYFAENQQCIMAHQASMEHVLDLQATLKSKSLDMALWARVLHWALTTQLNREAVVKILCYCFFLRAAQHCTEVQEMSNEQAERVVAMQREKLRLVAFEARE
ncbi:unnamed protein product [Durusdinium trenchii]|uniref:Mannosylglycerate synthase GT domain-containing protein n=1 Tax=Durusdinium trenchii TaxID=1381693 RepID=A0ABP0T1B1_9DINO